MLQVVGLAVFACIFGGLFCLVGLADKSAHSIFRFWSSIIFGGGFGAIFFGFIWIAFPLPPNVVNSLAAFGFCIGGLLGSFSGWKYTGGLQNKRTREI
jgi:hypothetical protein